MEVLSASGAKLLLEHLKNFSECLVVLYFYVEDSAECDQMDDVITELSQTTSDKAAIIKINASKDEEISKKYNITSVPAFVFIQDSNVVDNLVGANAPIFSKKFEENLKSSTESMEDRLKKLVKKSSVMLFMKGSPVAPRCGFSKQVIALLNSHDAKYETFDILEDYEVREALKKFSNWPTYPQLYVNGELIGGLDILKDLAESGELSGILSA